VSGQGGCLVAGWITLQMAGKRKTRKACYAFVRDTDLYHGPRVCFLLPSPRATGFLPHPSISHNNGTRRGMPWRSTRWLGSMDASCAPWTMRRTRFSLRDGLTRALLGI
jgi:hypothetical protein